MIQGPIDTKEPIYRAHTQKYTSPYFDLLNRKLEFMPETKVHVEVDGKIDTLEDFVLVFPQGTDTTISVNSDVYLLGKATVLVYSTFLNECARYSDQDLYEVCKAIDLDYNVIEPLVRKVRSNG